MINFNSTRCFVVVITLLAWNLAPAQTIWTIGTRDNSAAEFALAPKSYKDFLKHDFGWEDKYFIIGHSNPKTDWPYILPGPADAWGGSEGLAGKRSHQLNILFRLKSQPWNSDCNLIIDLLDTHSKAPPIFKVTVNGKSFKYLLPKGGGDTILTGYFNGAKYHSIKIPVAGLLKTGGNQITLTTIEGSWLMFDDIRLEGDVLLDQPGKNTYVRNVAAAKYQTGAASQPLLVDVEHLTGSPTVTVKLDNKRLIQQTLEKGRHILEVPMPAVAKPVNSKYEVLVNDEIVETGVVARSPQPVITPADYVNTYLGSAHSRWMIAPGPWMPFSMVKLSPDNENAGWQAGYDPTVESVGTFSHIHEWTMAGLGIMPVNGPLKINIGDEKQIDKDRNGYRSAIDKSTEETPLGYYKADLTDYNIKAELTATTRASFMRYTFPQDKDGRVMIDLQIPAEYRYDILKSSLKFVDDKTIEGLSVQQSKRVWSDDADQDYTIYFRIEFDQPVKEFGAWTNDDIVTGKKEVNAVTPKKAGCYATFNTGINPVVQVRTGISFVDMDGARKNLNEEIVKPFGWDFSAVVKANKNAWNEILGRVKIQTNDSREKMRFYSNLYRSFCRNTFSDVDGRWVDATEKIRQFKNPKTERALGCDAFWNTFWNLNQVWNLVTPEWSSRWVKSQLGMYDANGWLAKGPAGMEYIPVMVGEHEIPLMVSAYQMGIRDFDVQKVFEASKKMQTTPPVRIGNGFAGNRDIEAFLKHKYVPADVGRFSNTLEYAYDNWALGQLAKSLGKTNDHKIFNDRGYWWLNAIDTVTGYARMRYANGEWEKNFDPYRSGANHHYVEGNAWQLTYFVPQDVPALIKAIRKDRFLNRLSEGFKASEPWRYNAPGEQYWDFPVVQGNQQSMHFAFLFNWAGEPWQTQRWSRSIIDRYYGYGAADAYLGDEDQGQMSAWFVMAALGLFQTDGGANANPHYEIASPLYEKATIDLGEKYGRGKQFTIVANGASRNKKYVQSAKLNGKILKSFKFPASELLKGGTLELQMGDQPNEKWGLSH